MARSANARSRGPRPPAQLSLLDGRRRHQPLIVAMRATVAALAEAGRIDPYSYSILHHIEPWALVPAGLLAWTRARWIELASIDMVHLVAGEPIQILAAKGSLDRVVSSWPRDLADAWERVSIIAPLTCISYDRLCWCIDQARRKAGIRSLDASLDKTHIFRHLWASWRHSEGDHVETIAADLGHCKTDSTLAYIHSKTEIVRR